VLKVLADRARTRTDRGQVSVGVLIFQDLAIVPMVLLVPMLAADTAGSGGPGDVLLALGKAAAIIVLVLVVARRLMPPVLERVARTCSPELFLMSVLGICVGTAWLTSLAGVSLSLGAFLAGVLVSDTRFSQHALGEVMPIQILFNAAFFMSVGMLLDLSFVASNLLLVAGVLVTIVLVKTAAAAAGLLVLGRSPAFALGAALGLAQVGEFSFVLARVGAEHGLVPFGLEGAGSQVFIAASVLLMAATPLMQTVGERLAERGAEELDPEAPTVAGGVAAGHAQNGHALPLLENHVVVAGYGLAARRLTRVLHLSRVPFVVVTLSPQGSREAESHGYPTLYGDPARTRTLELAGALHAKTLVVPDDDPARAHQIAHIARALSPTMHVVSTRACAPTSRACSRRARTRSSPPTSRVWCSCSPTCSGTTRSPPR
jgi:CPA2 family monovalent cation:H+ antiporter-2